MYVDKQAILSARTADLYAFLLANHGVLFRRCGNSIYLKAKDSIYIKSGFYGYRDFATGETGNGIDFLRKYLRYTFQEAVLALSGCQRDAMTATIPDIPGDREIIIPEPAPYPHKRMFAYLMSRGIPGDAVRTLSASGLAYQEDGTGNIVFINKERDYCELRGTLTFAEKQFHGCRKTRADRFWYFVPGKSKPKTALITESAIDAISLWLLQRNNGEPIAPAYISIGGVANYSAIDRISRRIKTVIAVDNDLAGDLCRERYKDLRSIIPTAKDWNEDLNNGLNKN